MTADGEQMAIIATDIQYIKRDIEAIKVQLEAKYVTQDQFDPIKRIVYGMVGIILTSALIGILVLVIGR